MMIIGAVQSVNVLSSELSDVLQRSTTAPGEGLPAELRDEQIGHQTSVSAVSFRKGVDDHKSVMKAERDFVWWVYRFLDPVTRVSQKTSEANVDLSWVDTDVLAGCSRRPCPSPHIAEHSLVQIEDELFRQDLTIAQLGGPSDRFVNIDLLRLIEVGPRCDPGLPEAVLLLRPQGSRVIRLCE